jgi:hypothetical protein
MAITRQEIDAMYMDLFGRQAKDAGAEYWMDKVSSGFTTAEDLPRHLKYAANTTEGGRADLAYGTRLREQAAAQAAAEAAAAEEREAQRIAEVGRQEQLLALMREQQAAQLVSQQRLQDQISMGIQGKGGTQQQAAPQSVFGDTAPQPTQETMQEPAMTNDIDTGSGYYRNPYASGYGMGYQGMGYQDPYAGMRYMPQSGLMGGSSGFGGKGGMSPYGSPYGSSFGSPYGSPYESPYGSPYVQRDRMSLGKGGYSPSASADGGAPYYNPNSTPGQLTAPTAPPSDFLSDVMAGVPVTNTMDIADADPTQTLQGAAIASDGSNVVDFTPYAGDEFVRIGDQVVSRADLQRRGSDYYTRPVQEPPMQMYPMMRRQQYPMYGGKGGYYR